MIEDMPKEGQEKRKGLVWTEAELLEYSAVSVPANPGALVSRDVASLARKALGENSIAMVKAFGAEQFLAMPQKHEDLKDEELSAIIKALKPVKG